MTNIVPTCAAPLGGARRRPSRSDRGYRRRLGDAAGQWEAVAGGAKSALLGEANLTLSSAMAAEAVVLLGRPRTVVVHTDLAISPNQRRRSLRPSEPPGFSETLVSPRPGETVTL